MKIRKTEEMNNLKEKTGKNGKEKKGGMRKKGLKRIKVERKKKEIT